MTGVLSQPVEVPSPPAATVQRTTLRLASSRRIPPTPLEQARRVAWGKKWGNIMHEYAVARGWKPK